MITYDWNCKTVDAYPQDGAYTDLVYNVHYIVSGEDEIGNVATNIGTQSLDVSDVTEFIPFEDLTNEIVVGWTKSALGEEQVAYIEASIASQIEQMIKPTSVTLTIGEPVAVVD